MPTTIVMEKNVVSDKDEDADEDRDGDGDGDHECRQRS